jgi:tetratricopeptide (TPR) repeat protein
MTQRVREKIEEIERANEFASRREELSTQSDRGLPNVEIPDTKLSLQVVSDVLRKLLRNEPQHLAGEITSSAGSGKMEIRCRILQSGALLQAGKPHLIDATVGDNTVEVLARELTRLTDPYLLGIYLEEEKKDYSEASEVANQMLSSGSDADHMYEKAHLLRGFIASATSRPDEAIAEDRAAINLDPHWAYAHHCLAFVFDRQGKLDESAQEYRQAISMNEASIHWWSTRRNPDSANPHINLSWVLLEQHKPDDAIAESRRAIAIDPKSAYARYILGSSLDNRNRRDEAVAEYRVAIRLDPRYANPHAGLAVVAMEKNKMGDAMAEVQRALQLDPDLPFAHYLLGIVLRNQYQSDEAIREFKTAIRLYPRYPEAHVGIGQAMHSRGDPDPAVEAEYRAALQLDPNSCLAHDALGTLFYSQDKTNEAVAEYNIAIHMDPNFALAHNDLGSALLYQNKMDEAVAEYQTAIRLYPDSPVYHYNLGYILNLQGKKGEADIELKKGHDLDPTQF